MGKRKKASGGQAIVMVTLFALVAGHKNGIVAANGTRAVLVQ
jgi:hypothetical protein